MPHNYRTLTNRWYSSRRWKARRERQLSAHPLCRMCLDDGLATPATVADHVIPHRGDERLFWQGVLQSLCKRHHDSDKALIEAGRAPKLKIGEDGWPIGLNSLHGAGGDPKGGLRGRRARG